jgi:hypothetical protein
MIESPVEVVNDCHGHAVMIVAYAHRLKAALGSIPRPARDYLENLIAEAERSKERLAGAITGGEVNERRALDARAVHS